MSKSKLFILVYLLPFIGIFAFTNGFTPTLYKKAATAPAEVRYNIPQTVSCAVSSVMTTSTPENWSNPATWGGTVPIAGQNVIIPASKYIIMDVSPPALGSLTINGKLEFARQNLNLTAQYIMVMGSLHIGTLTFPFAQKATITLNGSNMNENVMGMGTRGIMVMGGILELHGTPPNKTWTKIGDHAAAGATTVNLSESVSWNINDQIVVATTDYFMQPNSSLPAGTPGNTGISAQRTHITSIPNTTTLNFANGLNSQRWGKLQHLTASGMSLSPGTLPAGYIAGTPTILDERAEVANLTRNIVIQSPDDALWQNNGFGCHVMVMKSAPNTQGQYVQGVAHVNGIEIKRGGQSGKLGRYPFHWHMLSYQGTQTLADATGQYIRNSVVNQSGQRGIVIHGTNGAEVKNNIVFDTRGHGIFTEDAAERRNIIDGNLVMKVRDPLPINVLKDHESSDNFGSSGFWISNPDNTVRNNIASDCSGFGMWLAFPEKTFGECAAIVLKPRLMKFGVFNNNTAHSNLNGGIFIDHAEIDEAGNTSPSPQYTSTTNMLEPQWPFSNVLTYELGDYTVWKNNTSGIWNRSAAVRNRRVVSSDNTSKFFSGTSNTELPGSIEKSLVVGTSLNFNMNGITRPDTYGSEVPVAFASYHSTFDIFENIVVNFPAVQSKSSGAFAIDDYYLIPVDKGNVRNLNNVIINSHAGVRINPSLPSFAFGVLWDAHDYWGGPANQDNYYVFNTSFFTHGQTPTVVAPNSAVSGGIVVEGPFYGVSGFVINKANSPYTPLMEIQINRLNSALATVGTYAIDQGVEGGLLQVMRHFATHPTGIYDLKFPTINNINDFVLDISNMLTTNDYQVIGVEYSGDYLISGLFSSTAHNFMDFGGSIPLPTNANNTKVYQAVSSLAQVRSATVGEVYWQDRINNKVWFKIRGGLNPGNPNVPVVHDYNLYKNFKIRAYGIFSPLSTTSIDNNFSKLVKVYPNPFTNQITINAFSNMSNVKIINASGQVLYNQGLNADKTVIDTDKYVTGIYILSVSYEDGRKESVKIIKQ